MTINVVILGTGGNCIDILDAIFEINSSEGEERFSCRGFLDDNKELWGAKIQGVEVLGPLDIAENIDGCKFVNGIGSPDNFWKKEDILRKAKIAKDDFVSIIHPTASVSKMASIGLGSVVLQGACVASNAVVSDHVMVLPCSVISHDCKVGAYSCLAAGVCVSGGVTIGESCYLGSNSSVLGGLTIGHNSMVGMGSVVLESVDDNCVVVGNPAKYLRNVPSA